MKSEPEYDKLAHTSNAKIGLHLEYFVYYFIHCNTFFYQKTEHSFVNMKAVFSQSVIPFNHHLIDGASVLISKRNNNFDQTLFAYLNYAFCVGSVGQYTTVDL